MNRHEVLSQVGKTVRGLITQLTPDPEVACFKAFEKMGHLYKISKSIDAGEIPSYFTKGIQDVINSLDAFRTGFARTAEEEGSGFLDGSATVTKSGKKELTIEEFVAHAQSVVKSALAANEAGKLGDSLAILHKFYDDIFAAASFADDVASKITVTVQNDPMRVVETEVAGTMNPAGTSRPDIAASDYVTNPGDVNAAPPLAVKNPSTGSVEALVSATPLGDSNYIAAKADVSISKSLSDLSSLVEKAGPSSRFQDAGWASDLNSPEFLEGTKPSVTW